MNETPHAPVVEQVLVAAAFGNQPGSWPLPTAITPHHLWLRAVAAGGQGRYAHAYGDLSVLRRLVPAGPLASLAHSTQGSLLRQQFGTRWRAAGMVVPWRWPAPIGKLVPMH